MNRIAFIDIEVNPKTQKVLDFGGVKENQSSLHSGSRDSFTSFIKGVEYLCGHNILNHDLKYIADEISEAGIEPSKIIDTLYLSALLFPSRPYHALIKDDKLQTEDANNPLNDSINARNLFNDEITAFQDLEDPIKQLLYMLLHDKSGFGSFFSYISYECRIDSIEALISDKFRGSICENANLTNIINKYPVELAYCLALISAPNRYSITPPWVLKQFPYVESLMYRLRGNPCLSGCSYCNQSLDVYRALKEYFGFSSYRDYANEPLQEMAVKAAVDNKSILAIFPTGGGKSIAFQVPALMVGAATKGLTVVISPLQSLMKDQVDNLERVGITDAVTINGLLDPIERAKSFERVEDGSASILYISPESLRSRTIERLLLSRNISRFVIDEAHCISSWGQDFRVDYLYIGDFIKSIQVKKNLEYPIPVSCFTATAKRKVIEDICHYYKMKLGVSLEVFSSKATRTNLSYKVFKRGDEEEKYNTARDLIGEKNCPTIIYVSRTKRAYQLAERLTADGFMAKPYHGKMDVEEKTENQNAFIAGEIPIMVATSAFGMGVDKKDVGMVIHYDVSDSLENYIQEAGRAGRDESITADCYILYNEDDLNKHFVLLNQTKLSIKEIQQVWNAIKDITRFRTTVSNSALEIARKAGWDDTVEQIETRVKTAVAALEDAGYLKRGQNSPRIFANSILTKSAQEAIDRINASPLFNEKQKEKGIRIIKKLFSSKSRRRAENEAGESRIDYISDHLGIVKEEVIRIIYLMREERILADAKDLTVYFSKGEGLKSTLSTLENYRQIESFLLSVFDEVEKSFHIKALNENAEAMGYSSVTPRKIRTVINFWVIKNWIKRHNDPYSNNHIAVVCTQPKQDLKGRLEKRHVLAKFMVEALHQKRKGEEYSGKPEAIEFSVLELKEAYEKMPQLFRMDVSIDDIEDALFYLTRIGAIIIEGGFLVTYNRLTIDRLELDNKKRYKNDDYQNLKQFYESKIQQIHIVGEYAKKMVYDYKEALQFVDDYFQLNYASFLNKYFPGSRQNDIKRNITPKKFRELFGVLSPAQLDIIKDNENQHIAVAAGPGSGKTRVLVHKLASLLLMEDVKHEQLLMVTFSRAAAREFKMRLLSLIGNAANYIDIKTFHSYCFDLLGRVGTLEKSQTIVKETIERIKSGEVELNQISKTVLVIDEAQDMDVFEYELIKTLISRNDYMRVIAVGDDDQNIYEFRGASAKYLEDFIIQQNAVKHQLVENYRSKSNLVDYTNAFVETISHRLKNKPVFAKQLDEGVIKIVRYNSTNLASPLVTDIINAELSGSTCVLTRTNQEALQVNGLLLRNGIQSKLIQTNDDFNLYNLLELRYFLYHLNIGKGIQVISEESWENAKRKLRDCFQNSSKYEVCKCIVEDFEVTNPRRKYLSDFEVFVRESKLEDFVTLSIDKVLVSTIHRAKGREFDNVYIMLDKYPLDTDSDKRPLYVAMTRAKNNLTIHLNGNYLDNIKVDGMYFHYNNENYLPPSQLILQLTYRDVWLSFFTSRQSLISKLKSGDPLSVGQDGCLFHGDKPVLKYSRQFQEIIEAKKNEGYQLKRARVNFIVFWRNDETGQEIKVILPELLFIRSE